MRPLSPTALASAGPVGESAIGGVGTVENLHPVGRLFYDASTAPCTSHGVSQGDDNCLGGQVGLGTLTIQPHHRGPALTAGP
jgi:hypothetical protein